MPCDIQIHYPGAGGGDREAEERQERGGRADHKGAGEEAQGRERQVPEVAGRGQEGSGAEHGQSEVDQPLEEGDLLPRHVICQFYQTPI